MMNTCIKQLDSATNIWISTDWHLLKNKKKKGLEYLNDNADSYIDNQVKTVGPDDAFIFLGDLTDDGIINRQYLDRNIQRLSGKYKIMIIGNNDLWDFNYYYNLGFDLVTHYLVWRNFIFTHKPNTNIPESMINIHGHYHGKKEVKSSRHIGVEIVNPPINLNTLLTNKRLNNLDTVKEYSIVENSYLSNRW